MLILNIDEIINHWFLFHLFLGNVGSDVLLATNDDKLFAFGYNNLFCHGIEEIDATSSYIPDRMTEIKELSKKRIKGDDKISLQTINHGSYSINLPSILIS